MAKSPENHRNIRSITMEDLSQYFTRGYDHIIVPKAVREVPIMLSKMKREDGSYHSIATLEETLGHLFVPVEVIDERFIMIHYGFSRNGEEALFHEFLQGAGLVNMRGELQAVGEIDFANLNGNEYGIFSDWEIGEVPAVVASNNMV